LESEDNAQIQSAVDALMQASMKLGEAIYKAQQTSSGSEASESSEESTVEGEATSS